MAYPRSRRLGVRGGFVAQRAWFKFLSSKAFLEPCPLGPEPGRGRAGPGRCRAEMVQEMLPGGKLEPRAFFCFDIWFRNHASRHRVFD